MLYKHKLYQLNKLKLYYVVINKINNMKLLNLQLTFSVKRTIVINKNICT